uniref:D-xylose 1-dehydrogenase (NADP(+), D-xylono-1,5-lactone-forming) n=1 Tax=Zooxanthella nutricula TaxID=1333877 RepID=A0A7S2JP76_9DINO
MTGTVWGICSAGSISNDFCLALVNNGSNVAAVAASDSGRAKQFATDFGLPRSYGSYEELANDGEVTVVYVGSVHTKHMQDALLFLQAGKHVLVEKPMGVNEGQVQQLVAAAKEKGVFLMEGFWTRCFPVVRRVQDLLDGGSLGRALHVCSDFGFKAPRADLTHRLWSKDLAGGGLLDIGCYVLQWASLALGRDALPEFRAVAAVGETGVDHHASIILQYPAGGTAMCSYSFDCAFHDRTVIKCERGIIWVDEMAHAPTKIRIMTVAADGTTATEDVEVALPRHTRDCGGRTVNFGNSEGFQYEVQEVERCLAEGLKESPQFTLSESALQVRLMDAVRKEIGVAYPADVA